MIAKWLANVINMESGNHFCEGYRGHSVVKTSKYHIVCCAGVFIAKCYDRMRGRFTQVVRRRVHCKVLWPYAWLCEAQQVFDVVNSKCISSRPVATQHGSESCLLLVARWFEHQ